MPIYAYRCSACGYAKDVLQKLSDPLLTVCPSCGASAFEKQLTAAGFQLKGSGWYVTDFRDGGQGKKPAADAKNGDAPAATTPDSAPKGGDSPASGNAAAVATPTASSPSAAPAPAASPAVSSPSPSAPGSST